MKFSWKKYKLRLNQPFVLSYGSFDFRYAFVVTLEQKQEVGYGEATAITYYGWTEDKITSELNIVDQRMKEGESPMELIADLNLSAPVRNALSCAWHDVQARLQKKTLRAYFDLPLSATLTQSSLTISGSTRVELEQQIDNNKWPNYKIKMGSDSDLMKLDVIKNHPESKFRIDANAGWQMEWVRANKEALQLDNIECIEQPFSVDQPELNIELKKIVDKPLFADESCKGVQDVFSCKKYFDGVNLKLMKCGGWKKSLALVEAARDSQLKIMLGCMTETSIGISHAAQLLGVVDMADIDGSYLIANDPATGTYLKNGSIYLNASNGSGALMKN